MTKMRRTMLNKPQRVITTACGIFQVAATAVFVATGSYGWACWAGAWALVDFALAAA